MGEDNSGNGRSKMKRRRGERAGVKERKREGEGGRERLDVIMNPPRSKAKLSATKVV